MTELIHFNAERISSSRILNAILLLNSDAADPTHGASTEKIRSAERTSWKTLPDEDSIRE